MATQEEMLEEALDDTIEAIEDAAAGEIDGHDIKAEVLDTAKAHWRTRYKPKYKKAIEEKGRIWDNDKKKVLLRAKEVGRLAAFIAILVSVLDELISGGVGHKPGQEIKIGEAKKPRIDAVVAECASLLIDCEQRDLDVHPDWDWCPRPNASPLTESVQRLLARFASEHAATGVTPKFKIAIKGPAA